MGLGWIGRGIMWAGWGVDSWDFAGDFLGACWFGFLFTISVRNLWTMPFWKHVHNYISTFSKNLVKIIVRNKLNSVNKTFISNLLVFHSKLKSPFVNHVVFSSVLDSVKNDFNYSLSTHQLYIVMQSISFVNHVVALCKKLFQLQSIKHINYIYGDAI